MNSAEREKTYYHQDNVRVTTSRFIVGGQAYSLGQITSVKMEKIPPKTGCLTLLMIGCGLIGIIFLFSGAIEIVSNGFTNTAGNSLWPGLGLFGLAVLLYFGTVGSKPTYSVTITTSAGETRALKSQDPDEIRPVVEAINEVMIDRG